MISDGLGELIRCRNFYFSALIHKQSGMESNQIDVSNYHNRKSPIAMKKVALKDVHNNNRSDGLDYTAKSWSLGLPTIHESKVVGIKRPNPLTSPNKVNDHLLNGGLKVDKEMAKRKTKEHTNTSRVSFAASVPHFLDKPGNSIAALDSNHLKINLISDVHDFLSSDNDHGQHMGRLHRLHNLLKYYDEFDRREYVHVLRSLAPLELNRHAVELEKRSIQLSYEEGKEIQRMKALNILGNVQQ